MDNLSKEEILQEAIRNGGFYGKSGIWNSIIKLPEDDKIYRKRVETIIIRDKKEIFVKKKPDSSSYELPGGSTEKDIPDEQQAINECREEAYINLKNIYSSGISYKKLKKNKWAKKEYDIVWDGNYTIVYVGEHDSMFHGKIRKEDQDPSIRSGRWYPIKECLKFFMKEHKDALIWYLKNMTGSEDEQVTESYTVNWIKNTMQLKDIAKHPEVRRNVVIEWIDHLKKSYVSIRRSKKGKEILISPKVGEYYFSSFYVTFNDKSKITFCINLDESSFTDGCASDLGEELGKSVIIFPKFFKASVDSQIFTLLHEVGHIRLGHVDIRNTKTDIFGNDKTEDYRRKLMRKNSVMYPEVNADLYAVLNGATMATILTIGENIDYDKKYDYRFTNAEAANRYKKVFNKYGRLRGFQTYESTGEISRYDLACLTIFEMVYDNRELDFLSDESKEELHEILHEYVILYNIPETSSLQSLMENYEDNSTDINRNLLEESKAELYDKIYHNDIITNDNIELVTESIKKDAKDIISNISYKLESKKNPDNTKVEHIIFLLESLMNSIN